MHINLLEYTTFSFVARNIDQLLYSSFVPWHVEFGMLATKLIVPITRRIHTNIFKFLLRDNQCGREACKNLRKNVRKEKVTFKCKEYEEKLAKCPKRVKECKDSPQSPTKVTNIFIHVPLFFSIVFMSLLSKI